MPREIKMNLVEFLGEWFKKFQTQVFNVRLTNDLVNTKVLEAKVDKLGTSLAAGVRSLMSHTFKVKVTNPTKVESTKQLEDKLDALLNAMEGLGGKDSRIVESKLERLILAVKDLKKVKAPSSQTVSGKVDVSNLPKTQAVTGKVELSNLKPVVDGLQVIVDAIEDLRMEVTNMPVGGGGGVVATPMGSHKEQIVGLTKFDADDSAPDYVGTNERQEANDGDTDWTILKYTYSGSNVTQIQTKKGAWSNRTSLF